MFVVVGVDPGPESQNYFASDDAHQLGLWLVGIGQSFAFGAAQMEP